MQSFNNLKRYLLRIAKLDSDKGEPPPPSPPQLNIIGPSTSNSEQEETTVRGHGSKSGRSSKKVLKGSAPATVVKTPLGSTSSNSSLGTAPGPTPAAPPPSPSRSRKIASVGSSSRPPHLKLSNRSQTLPTSGSGCPTIAAALWRPLWPPGWHPRGAGGLSQNQDDEEEEKSVQGGSKRVVEAAGHQGHTSPSSGGTWKSRPKTFLSKYTALRHPLPIITMSEPTDDDATESDSPCRSRKKNKHRAVSVDVLDTSGTSSSAPSKITVQDIVQTHHQTTVATTTGRRTPVEEHENMEAWLDEHPAFLGNYFVRKASRSIVDAWLLAHTVPQSAGRGGPATSGTSSSASAPASGATTPVRKISATEFEKGSLFLRPMVSTTQDGTPTFLPIPLPEGVSPLESPKTPPRKSRKELEALDEKQLIFELVKDISTDLDVKSLCHKILQNVSILTNADRCSLFLVKGDKADPNRHFVSTLFDVSSESTIEQMEQTASIKLPWGTGIVGYVALSGESVHIPDCYADDRFSDMVDQKTGYRTRNMLCSPIHDIFGEVMGVAQVINKNPRFGPQSSIDEEGGGEHFGGRDQEIFSHYLQFCGIGLRNAQLFERSQLENKRNQVLLDLARMVFEEQSTLEHVVYRIMVHVQGLLEVERCQVLLVSEGSEYKEYNSASFRRVFDLEASDLQASNVDSSAEGAPEEEEEAAKEEEEEEAPPRESPFEGRFPINVGITGFVAATGLPLNIPDVYADSRFDQKVDEESPKNFRHKSILCMPIRNAQRKIIGVSQLINKLSGAPFNKNDENLFEAFSIFVGLGIQNVQMYEQVVKAMAKQRVTFEVLSYHATAPFNEAQALARQVIPSTQALRLSDLQFSDFSLDEDTMVKACLRMFLDLDLVERFHMDYGIVCRWLLSVRKNYRPVTYHNWRHAFNVAQMMFAILTSTGLVQVLGEIETLALLVACLSHDLDHRGTNNSFQVKSSSPLAQLYSTSVMERHHFDQCLMILNSSGNQIFGSLSPDEYRRAVHVLEEAILATDLAIYFNNRSEFFRMIEAEDGEGLFGPKGQFKEISDDEGTKASETRSILRHMLMTSCDIAAITKPWEVQRVVAQLVASEFFQQGDIERDELNMEPADMMNREKKDELPKMQVSFIDSICLPIYEAFWKLFPDVLRPLYDGVVSNRNQWLRLAQEQDTLKDWADEESERLIKDNADKKRKSRESLKLRQQSAT